MAEIGTRKPTAAPPKCIRVHDIAPIKSLYKTVYPSHNSEKFDWLIACNPAGPAYSYCAVEPGSGDVVGSVQVIPQRVNFNCRIVQAGQIIDGMVLKEYRGRRIFNRLTRAALDDLGSAFEYIIGFPNELSLGPCLKAGFQILTSMSTFVMPLSGHYISRRLCSNKSIQRLADVISYPLIAANRLFRPKGTSVALRRQANAASPAAANLHHSLQIPHSVTAVRDLDFLKWRFFQLKLADYEFFDVILDGSTIGYIVVRNKNRDREIVDLLLPANEGIIVGTLKSLVDCSHASGFDSIQIQCPPTNYFVPAFRAAGFRELHETGRVIIYPFSKESHSVKANDYFLTHADSDWI
jgi:hypothetical protein